MKSFIKYLSEADYSRFLKKNNNLSSDQRKEINKFYSKTNPQAGSLFDKNIGWQNKKIRSMTYDDFVNDMVNYKSGRKIKLKHSKLSGLKEGLDYINVRMKNKNYLAYIPLNFKTAQKFNTKSLGVCQGDWCIGHSSTPFHWNEEVISDQQVPIYVIDTNNKWIVMIRKNNKDWDTFDVDNTYSTTKKELIPNFDVRKELLTSYHKKLYDDVRLEFFIDPEFDDEYESEDELTVTEQLFDEISTIEGWGNSIDTENITFGNDVIDFIIGLAEEKYVSNSTIVVQDDYVEIIGGTIYNWEDWLIDETLLERCIIRGGSFDSIVEILSCDIWGGDYVKCEISDCIIYKGNISDSDIIKGKVKTKDSIFNECNFIDTLVDNGTFDKCEFRQQTKSNYRLSGGEYNNCDIAHHILDGNFFDCKIYNWSSRIDNSIYGGDYLGCDINGCDIYRSEFTECDIYKSTIKDSTLIRCTIDDNNEIRSDVIIDNKPYDAAND